MSNEFNFQLKVFVAVFRQLTAKEPMINNHDDLFMHFLSMSYNIHVISSKTHHPLQ